MKRLALALAAGAAVSTLAYASASALTVDGGTIQAGSSNVTCDTDGVKANWGLETDTNSVSNIRVSGIDEACIGADIFVKVNGGTKLTTTITDVQENLPIDPAMTPESIQNVKIWIEG